MLATEAVKNLIREGSVHMLDNVIGTSAHLGMVTLERSLADLVAKNLIDISDALKHAQHPEELRRLSKMR
jgi:twitching motility protein PilT